MENEKSVVETSNSENEEIVIEEVDNENDDNEFLRSLEEIDNEESQENQDDEKAKAEEELKIKNKNAEEARKRREAEAKAKAEAEEKEEAKKENPKTKEEEEDSDEDEDDDDVKTKELTPQEQVKELANKHPDVDLGELDRNKDFQEYLQGKWHKNGKTITEIYEAFIDFETRISKKEKKEIESKYKKSGPSIKGGGGNGGNGKDEQIYSMEELQSISEKMPFMKPSEYAKIEEKFERSVKHHKKNN